MYSITEEEKLKVGVVEVIQDINQYSQFRNFEIEGILNAWNESKNSNSLSFDDFMDQQGKQFIDNAWTYLRREDDSIHIIFIGKECGKYTGLTTINKTITDIIPAPNGSSVEKLVRKCMDDQTPMYILKTMQWQNQATILYETLFLPLKSDPRSDKCDYSLSFLFFESQL